MNQQRYKQFEKPAVGKQYGFIYPLTWKILDLNRYFSLHSWLRIKTVIGSDIYVLSWLTIEVVSLFWVGACLDHSGFLLWTIFLVILYRYIDCTFVLLSMLIRRFVKYDPRGQGKTSANRTLLLVILNGVEVIIMFALLNYCCSILFPGITKIEPVLNGAIDSFYYSVVTGTTLGYGDFKPVGELGKILAISEVLSIFLIFISIVGFASSIRSSIPDLEVDDKP
jgi:hypothetical protein